MYKNHYLKEINRLSIELYEEVLYQKSNEELYPLTIKLVKNVTSYINALALEQDLNKIYKGRKENYETIRAN